MKVTAIIVLCVAAFSASAQPGPPSLRSDVISLEAEASNEVAFDIAKVTLVTEVDNADPAGLMLNVNQTLDETLREAKANTNVTASSGGYSTFPVTDRDGRITAWRARAELILESRDFKELSSLAGRLSKRMQVGGINFLLSPEARRAEEDKLLAQAISRFQSRAQSAAKAFGYTRFSLLEATIHAQSPAPPPRPLLRSAVASAAAPVPVEGGRTTVTVSVSGSVKLER